jgi:hypothetical protein
MEEIIENVPLQYQEPVFAKAIVNGLIATSVLWIFWTPFIIFLAVPLISAQLKQGLCSALVDPIANTKSNSTGEEITFFEYLYEVGLINAEQRNKLIRDFEPSYNSSDIPAKNIILQDAQTIESSNLALYVVFTSISCIVITLSLYVAHRIIQANNLNTWEIVNFNIVMAVIIITIETAFFIGVAMQYVPFDIPKIANDLKLKIVGYLDTLIAPIPNYT